LPLFCVCVFARVCRNLLRDRIVVCNKNHSYISIYCFWAILCASPLIKDEESADTKAAVVGFGCLVSAFRASNRYATMRFRKRVLPNTLSIIWKSSFVHSWLKTYLHITVLYRMPVTVIRWIYYIKIKRTSMKHNFMFFFQLFWKVLKIFYFHFPEVPNRSLNCST